MWHRIESDLKILLTRHKAEKFTRSKRMTMNGF
jgi:hypothetical protein